LNLHPPDTSADPTRPGAVPLTAGSFMAGSSLQDAPALLGPPLGLAVNRQWNERP
jgi:hypothetical protein